jgi:N6-adenosine-specific RNA methylase IME4
VVDAAVTDVGLEAALAAPEPFGGLRRRHYAAICVDPASKFQSYTAIRSQNPSSVRSNERHYRVMSFSALAALPVKELATPTGCHLFLWTASAHLEQALKLIEAWDFKYSAIAFVWLKTRRNWDGKTPLRETDFPISLGLTTRHQTELVLLARRGNSRRLRKDVRELIIAPRREHSRKPDQFFDRVENYCCGPYCELFSRQQRSNWDCWGDELEKFGGARA